MCIWIFHVYLMSNALTSREFRSVRNIKDTYNHPSTDNSGNVNSRTKRVRPVYITESGKNLFSKGNALSNIVYMLFTTYEPVAVDSSGFAGVCYQNGEAVTVRQARYNDWTYERHCYCLRDVATLLVTRNRQTH